MATEQIPTSIIADDAVTGAKIENNPTVAGNLTVSGTSTLTGALNTTNIKHASSGSNNLVLASDGTTTVSGALTASGGIANAGTISAGTIGTSVTFPTRSDFGIIETFASGSPLIGSSSSQDFSYTSGQEYCVIVFIYFADSGFSTTEIYRINTDNTVSQIQTSTGNVTPTIPSSGTLRITTLTVRHIYWVKFIRMDW